MSLDRPDNPYAPPQATVADVSGARSSRPRSRIPLLVLLAFTVIWCVVLPFQWARTLSHLGDMSYLDALGFFKPEVAGAALVTASLAVLRLRPRVAVLGLVAAAVALPLLKFVLDSAGDTWPLSTALLCLSAWRVHARYRRAA